VARKNVIGGAAVVNPFFWVHQRVLVAIACNSHAKSATGCVDRTQIRPSEA
jgi:hypothetical protein